MPRLKGLHLQISRRLGPIICPIWPGRIDDIIFIVGSPRSGTTILGEILGQHPEFIYLFEPRYIWCHKSSKRNVWGNNITDGQLHWDTSDFTHFDQKKLSKWLHFSLWISGRRRLIEKLPLNVFRLRWLYAIFPRAKIIHIIRHGCDVAQSLEKLIEKRFKPGYWETHPNYLQFEQFALQHSPLAKSVEIVHQSPDNYTRSLLVWLCSVWEGRRAGKDIGENSYREIMYEDLVLNPKTTLDSIFEFVHEYPEKSAIQFAESQLLSTSIGKYDPKPAVTNAMTGEILDELGYSK